MQVKHDVLRGYIVEKLRIHWEHFDKNGGK